MTGIIRDTKRLDDAGEWVLGSEYVLDGVVVSKDVFDAAFPVRDLTGGGPGGHSPGCWPMKSWSAGVHPDQVGEAAAHAAKLGVPTSFTPDGDAIFRDRAHRKQFLKAHGMHDKDGGYSD